MIRHGDFVFQDGDATDLLAYNVSDPADPQPITITRTRHRAMDITARRDTL